MKKKQRNSETILEVNYVSALANAYTIYCTSVVFFSKPVPVYWKNDPQSK